MSRVFWCSTLQIKNRTIYVCAYIYIYIYMYIFIFVFTFFKPFSIILYTECLYMYYSRLCLIHIYCLWIQRQLRHLDDHMPDRHQIWIFYILCWASLWPLLRTFTFLWFSMTVACCLHCFVTNSYKYGILNITSGAENFVLQIAVRREYPCGEGISHYWPNQSFVDS
jgi:hypothetical protein